MEVPVDLHDLLNTPSSRVLAMDPTGGQTVDLPAGLDLGLAVPMQCDSPLDPIAREFQGSAVGAFESANRRGHGTTLVTMTDDDAVHRLHIFNMDKTHGCFVAVALPQDAEIAASDSPDVAPPRQGHFRVSASGLFLSVGAEISKMLGWDGEELVGRSVLDYVHPDDHENAIVGWIELLENPTRQCQIRQRFKTKSGDWLWCDVEDTNRLDDATNPHVLSEILDVSRELAAQAALQRRETLLDRLTQALPSGVLQLNAEGAAEIWNDQWANLTGSEPIAGVAGLLDSLDETTKAAKAIKAALDDGTDDDIEVTFNSDSAASKFGRLHVRPLREDDVHAGLLLTLDDVTRLLTYQDELAAQTQRDSLTGVYNRLGLENAIETQLDLSRQDETSEIAVLFLDLDRFKAINDAHGHATGDAVLARVADAVTELVRPTDIVGRLGGDEFLVMMACEDGSQQSSAIASRIKESVRAISDQMVQDLTVGVTIGIAFATATDDFDSLIKRADEAMYEQKRAKKLAANSPDRVRPDQVRPNQVS